MVYALLKINTTTTCGVSNTCTFTILTLYHLYADDPKIYISFSPNQSHDSLSMLSPTLEEVYAWLTSNRLSVNPSKTEFLIIGNPQQPNKIQSSSIVFCGNIISPSTSARNLGVTFDSSLSLTEHISSICKCAYYQNRQLRQIRSSLDISSAMMRNLGATLITARRSMFAPHVLHVYPMQDDQPCEFICYIKTWLL